MTLEIDREGYPPDYIHPDDDPVMMEGQTNYGAEGKFLLIGTPNGGIMKDLETGVDHELDPNDEPITITDPNTGFTASISALTADMFRMLASLNF